MQTELGLQHDEIGDYILSRGGREIAVSAPILSSAFVLTIVRGAHERKFTFSAITTAIRVATNCEVRFSVEAQVAFVTAPITST